MWGRSASRLRVTWFCICIMQICISASFAHDYFVVTIMQIMIAYYLKCLRVVVCNLTFRMLYFYVQCVYCSGSSWMIFNFARLCAYEFDFRNFSSRQLVLSFLLFWCWIRWHGACCGSYCWLDCFGNHFFQTRNLCWSWWWTCGSARSVSTMARSPFVGIVSAMRTAARSIWTMRSTWAWSWMSPFLSGRWAWGGFSHLAELDRCCVLEVQECTELFLFEGCQLRQNLWQPISEATDNRMRSNVFLN